ncbi:MAG: hypothetical protein P4L22_04625 [Candidatus Babeliales bacterium]|nr:hypothetical protein [Candidatus Babeliales bacterium]
MKNALLSMIVTIVSISSGLHGVGPKLFVKEGWNYCRNRESHPGRQCCYSVGASPLEIPALGAVNSNLREITGYGSDCWTTCECNTILPAATCRLAKECAQKVGPYFLCHKGQCKFRCLTNDDCNAHFGKGYECLCGEYNKQTSSCKNNDHFCVPKKVPTK